MPLQTVKNYSITEEQSPPPTDGQSSEPQKAARDTYYVYGGTGGAGGSGGKEGGGGGDGHGPILQAGTMHVVIQKHSEKDREIIEWASPLNFFPRQADTLDRHEPGTGQWLFRNSLYEQWKAGEIQGLWCCGMPGAGKTVLTSIVVHDLETNQPNETIGVAVLYLDHKEIGTQSPTNLLAAIWHQLVVAFDKPISPKVQELYRKHHARRTRPSLEEIYAVLRSTVEHSSVFVVVDALDEYPEDNRDTLLRCLWELRPTVRLMLTSRPGIDISRVIRNIPTLNVRATEEDILRYLDGQIKNSHRFQNHGDEIPNLRRLIEEKIVKRSDGMFLLAKLRIDPLMTEHSAGDVEDALASASSGLDGTYAGIVDRINKKPAHDKQLAWRTISWVLHARTPLQHSRLREALAVQPGSTAPDPKRQPEMSIVLSVCAGLVVIDEKDDKVHLIHYTTEMYLRSRPVWTSIFSYAESEITRTCIAYLTFETFHRGVEQPLLLFTNYPFLHYAVEYCLVHARGDPETDIQDLILSFLENCSVWWRLWNWKHGGRQSAPDRLRIAILFQLTEISNHIVAEDHAHILLQEAVARGAADKVRVLVENGIDLEKDSGTLRDAVMHGHEEIVGILLTHDVRPQRVAEARSNRYSIGLYEASRTGNGTIVEMLISHGANVNADGGEYGTALQAALWMQHEFVAHLLLEHGADINAEGGKGGKYGALQLACSWGHEGVVKRLLKHRNGFNAGSEDYDSVLREAVRTGRAGIVKLLLGANVNAVNGYYDSVLQDAVITGHAEIVALLLEHGGVVNGGKYRALETASQNGDEAIVKILLEHGTNANSEDGNHGCPLQLASRQGYDGIVKLLLEHGADVNAYDTSKQGHHDNGLFRLENRSWTRSALHIASEKGHKNIVRLLLDHGADVDAVDSPHGSTLFAASEQGHEDIIRLLIRYGADVNAGNSEHDSALHAASKQGHKGIVRLLLLHGADVRRAGSALQLASRLGHKAIVRLLLDHGADVDAVDSIHGSALHAAFEQGHEDIIRLLLENDANVNARGSMRASVLQSASEKGHEAIVQLLLEHGADVNEGGGCVLLAASTEGHAAIVELLLKHGADVNARFGSALRSDPRGKQQTLYSEVRAWSV